MGLDIRLPIGLMFVVLGPILVLTGVLQNTSLNVYTGASMCVFAAWMLTLAISAQKREAAEALQGQGTDPDQSREKAPHRKAA